MGTKQIKPLLVIGFIISLTLAVPSHAEMQTIQQRAPATKPVTSPVPAQTTPKRAVPPKTAPTIKHPAPAKKAIIDSVKVKGKTTKGTISFKQGTKTIIVLNGKNLDLIAARDIVLPGGVKVVKIGPVKKIGTKETMEVTLEATGKAGTYQVTFRSKGTVVKKVSVKVIASEKVYRTVKKGIAPVPPAKPRPKNTVAKKPSAGPPPKKAAVTKPGAKPMKPKGKSAVAKKPGKGSVAIDTVPLPEKTDPRKKLGKKMSKTTPGPGKATPARAKGTTPRTRPGPQTQTASKKPVEKADQVGIIDTNTKGKPKTPQTIEKRVLTQQRGQKGQVKTSGKNEQAGIIFVSKVSHGSSPTGKGASDTIVVAGRKLNKVTSAKLIGKDRKARHVRIISKMDGKIVLEKPPNMKAGTYQVKLYAGKEPIQVAQHIARVQIKTPPSPAAPPTPAPRPMTQSQRDKQTSPVKSAALASKQTAEASTTMETGQKPLSSGEKSKSGYKSSESSQSGSGTSSKGDVIGESNEKGSSGSTSDSSPEGEGGVYKSSDNSQGSSGSSSKRDDAQERAYIRSLEVKSDGTDNPSRESSGSSLDEAMRNSGLSVEEQNDFAKKMESLGRGDDLTYPSTWEEVRKKGTDKVLADAVRDSLGIPSDVAPDAGADDLLAAAEVIMVVGGEPGNSSWWNDFEKNFREQWNIPQDVGGTGKDFSMTDTLNDLGTIQALGREDSASSELWNDVASVRKGTMDPWDLFGKYNFGDQGTTPSRGQGSGGGTGDFTGGGEGSSGSQGPSSEIDSGGSGVGGHDSFNEPASGGSRSNGNETGASSGTATGGNAGTDGSAPSSVGGSGAGETTSNTGGSEESYTVDITHTDDGGFDLTLTRNSDGASVTDHFVPDGSGGFISPTSGETVTGNNGERPPEGSLAASGDSEGGANFGSSSNDDSGSDSDDSDSGSDDDTDSEDDSDSDDDSDDSDSGEDNGSDDSGDSDSSSDEDTMPVDPDRYARSSRTFQDLVNSEISPDGTPRSVEGLINPVDPERAQGSGPGKIDLENPAVDPVESERAQGSGPGKIHIKNPVVDPVEPERAQGSGSGPHIPKAGINPVADGETSGGDSSTESGSSTSPGGYIDPAGGSVALGSAAPSMGGGSMGPTGSWKCKRRLIRSQSGDCLCYCPRDTHPVTGAPIQQNVPCPIEAEGISTEEGQAQTTAGPDQSLFAQSDELDCKEYTDSEWKGMWPGYY